MLNNASRQLLAGGMALFVALALFTLMQIMIKPDTSLLKKSGDHAYLNFVRVKASDRPTETKQRKLPDEPPPPEQPPQTPDVNVQSQAQQSSPSLAMNLPNLSMPLSGGDGPFLGSPGGGGNPMAAMDSDVIPVMQVPPVYPRQAKQAKIEGFVKLEVQIRPDGSVASAKVIESKPGRLFDSSAKSAIMRWKFKPKMVDGKTVGQTAIQVIEFKLSK